MALNCQLGNRWLCYR